MLPEEHQLLSNLFSRVKAAGTTPRDREAEMLVAQAVRDQPSATYYLAQAVLVQEKGLEAADAHIRQLEQRIRELEAVETANQQGGGFLNSIFGSGQKQDQNRDWQAQPAPVPSQPSPGPWGRNPAPAPAQPAAAPWPVAGASVPSAGGSFLRGALGTAAGVAGGMLLANSLSGIFSNHMASSGWGSPFDNGLSGAAPIEETVINNYYGADGDTRQDAMASNDNGFDQAGYDDTDDDFGSDTTDV